VEGPDPAQLDFGHQHILLDNDSRIRGSDMGRETIRYVDEEERMKPRQMNPVWRGVGCLIIVTLGMVGYILSGVLLNANIRNHWIYIPSEIYAPSILPWLPPGAAIRIVIGIMAAMLGYGVISVVYAILFPIRLGETDVPPLRRSGRRKL
jgi:hypothetical protein